MRKSLTCILFLSLLSCNEDKQKQPVGNKGSKWKIPMAHRIPDSIFQYHFRILDSAAKSPPRDTMYHCCYNSANFMVENTGIDADVEYDYGGATGFKKEDLVKWHEWYDEKYGKKNE